MNKEATGEFDRDSAFDVLQLNMRTECFPNWKQFNDRRMEWCSALNDFLAQVFSPNLVDWY
jgi:hypothetical protein